MVFLKRTIDRTALKLGTGSVSSFSDASRISNYAKPSVSALVGAKVIGGLKGKNQSAFQGNACGDGGDVLSGNAFGSGRAAALCIKEPGDLINLCIGTQTAAML